MQANLLPSIPVRRSGTHVFSPISIKDFMTSRRRFIVTIPAAALALARAGSSSAQAAKLEEMDPQAVALGYRHDATKVDASKFPAYVAGRNCANCQLFQGKPGEVLGPCAIMSSKLVSAKGWCVAWVKKA